MGIILALCLNRGFYIAGETRKASIRTRDVRVDLTLGEVFDMDDCSFGFLLPAHDEQSWSQVNNLILDDFFHPEIRTSNDLKLQF